MSSLHLPRRALLGTIVAAPLLALLPRASHAGEPEIYAERGIAIDGSDPVAYFAEQGPVPGGADTTISWKGATWQFADSDNAARFKADPMSFAPQFGGYCAFAASRGYLAPTTPEAWTVYKGELFLNANLRARELFLQDLDGNIEAARGNWPGILG